jgi:hypothetical protein
MIDVSDGPSEISFVGSVKGGFHLYEENPDG